MVDSNKVGIEFIPVMILEVLARFFRGLLSSESESISIDLDLARVEVVLALFLTEAGAFALEVDFLTVSIDMSDSETLRDLRGATTSAATEDSENRISVVEDRGRERLTSWRHLELKLKEERQRKYNFGISSAETEQSSEMSDLKR